MRFGWYYNSLSYLLLFSVYSVIQCNVVSKLKFQASPILIGDRPADVEAKRANSRG